MLYISFATKQSKYTLPSFGVPQGLVKQINGQDSLDQKSPLPEITMHAYIQCIIYYSSRLVGRR